MMRLIVGGVVVPAAMTAAVLLAGLRFRRGSARNAAWTRGALAPATWCLALAAGYVSGHLACAGWPGFPPGDVTNWVPYVVAAVALGTLFVRPDRPPGWAWLLLTLAVSGAAVWMTCRPMIDYAWSATQAALWVTGLLVALAFTWRSGQALAARTPARDLVVAEGIGIVGGAVALGASGSVLLAQLAGMLAASLGSALLFSIVLRFHDEPLGRSALDATVVGFVVLLINGVLYSRLPLGVAVVFAALVSLPRVWWFPRVSSLARWKRLALVGVLEICIVGAMIAWLLTPRQSGAELPY